MECVMNATNPTPADLMATMQRIEKFLMAAIQTKQAPLTVKAFAQRVGMGRETIRRRIKAGLIRKQGGRIPASELSKFLS
jgi:response regulator of citrate/malate metabolism